MRLISSSEIKGTINAPPSKSVMIRAVAVALLTSGTSEIRNPSLCGDSLAALSATHTLGADIRRNDDVVTIRGNAGLKERSLRGNLLDCGESGLCMRMFAPIAGLSREEITLAASGSLSVRPMKIVEALEGLGALCRSRAGFPPVRVKGGIAAGNISISGAESSQFLTGLLMALPLCDGDSRITVEGLASGSYVELTLDVMDRFGVMACHNGDFSDFHVKGGQRYRPSICTIEGDWSGAAFFLVAGALAGFIEVKGLNMDSCQGDKTVMEALISAGARVKAGDGSVVVERGRLNAFEFDARDCPDLFPPLVTLASGCAGRSVIYGAGRLKHKESDRAQALVEEFSRLGFEIRIVDDRMEIRGGGRARGGVVHSHNDHRIAMSCAIAGIAGEGDVLIKGSRCVSKSYPMFFEDLNSVKVKS